MNIYFVVIYGVVPRRSLSFTSIAFLFSPLENDPPIKDSRVLSSPSFSLFHHFQILSLSLNFSYRTKVKHGTRPFLVFRFEQQIARRQQTHPLCGQVEVATWCCYPLNVVLGRVIGATSIFTTLTNRLHANCSSLCANRWKSFL